MSEIVDQSLQKITKGAGIILVGTAAGMLLGFISKVMLVRYITQSEYGIFSLASVLLSIFVVISTLGLEVGSTRQIAYYRGKGDASKVRGVVLSSLQVAVISSILLSLVLFFTSNLISINIFHSPELSAPSKLFSIAIPFTVLIGILTSIFRGFDKVEPKVYFQHIGSRVLSLLFLLTVILLRLPFLGVIYAYVASVVFTCIALAIFTIKKLPLPIPLTRGADAIINPLGKELVLFSLPLLAVVMLGSIIIWTDTLMLGYFRMPSDVGLYNAALPLASLLAITLTAMNFLYIPIMSQLYAKNQTEEIKRSYAVLTKWAFSATLPVFLVVFLFPEAVLNILFGSRYIGAAFALQILALGFFIHTIPGPINSTLVVMGKTRFLMWSALITTIVNIILNIFLIPPLGIIGAAIATASSFLIRNILWVTRLYSLSKMHPFTKNYLKPIIATVVPVLIIYVLAKNLFYAIPFWLLPILFILFLGVYALAILVTKSFDREDIAMLLAIEERLEINTTPIKKILRRFL